MLLCVIVCFFELNLNTVKFNTAWRLRIAWLAGKRVFFQRHFDILKFPVFPVFILERTELNSLLGSRDMAQSIGLLNATMGFVLRSRS